MTISRFFILPVLALSIGSGALARSSKVDNAFVDAVKHRDMQVFNSLFGCIQDQSTFDKALRAAARKGDVNLCLILRDKASIKGRRRAARSLARHHKCYFYNCPYHSNMLIL